jgi:hypothetical protein
MRSVIIFVLTLSIASHLEASVSKKGRKRNRTESNASFVFSALSGCKASSHAASPVRSSASSPLKKHVTIEAGDEFPILHGIRFAEKNVFPFDRLYVDSAVNDGFAPTLPVSLLKMEQAADPTD